MRDAVEGEKLPHQPGVGAAGKAHALHALDQSELRRKRPSKRAHPRTAGVQQRTINVEEDESDHGQMLRGAAQTGNQEK